MTPTKNQNEKGQFKKGNNAFLNRKRIGIPKDLRDIKKACKEDVYKCAFSLTLPVKTCRERLADCEISSLQYITSKAVMENNFKFIHWLLEMVVGKPPQTDPEEGEERKPFIIEKLNGDKELLGNSSLDV